MDNTPVCHFCFAEVRNVLSLETVTFGSQHSVGKAESCAVRGGIDTSGSGNTALQEGQLCRGVELLMEPGLLGDELSSFALPRLCISSFFFGTNGCQGTSSRKRRLSISRAVHHSSRGRQLEESLAVACTA